jgi:dolichol-phosphate mannosyltransferase
MTSPSTLICMPTYNEAGNIERIVAAIHEVVPHVHVLVIDDGSPDGTGGIADSMSDADDRVHVLHRTEKAGLGPAYLAGFDWALQRDYDYVFEMDADFSHRPKYLVDMLRVLDDGADVAIGSRYVTGGGTENWGMLRRLLSRGGGIYARTILGIDVQDLTAGFIGWRRNVLETINLSGIEASGYVFQIEMKFRAYQAGFNIVETPITFPDREVGESKMTPGIAMEAVTKVWKIRLKKAD